MLQEVQPLGYKLISIILSLGLFLCGCSKQKEISNKVDSIDSSENNSEVVPYPVFKTISNEEYIIDNDVKILYSQINIKATINIEEDANELIDSKQLEKMQSIESTLYKVSAKQFVLLIEMTFLDIGTVILNCSIDTKDNLTINGIIIDEENITLKTNVENWSSILKKYAEKVYSLFQTYAQYEWFVIIGIDEVGW